MPIKFSVTLELPSGVKLVLSQDDYYALKEFFINDELSGLDDEIEDWEDEDEPSSKTGYTDFKISFPDGDPFAELLKRYGWGKKKNEDDDSDESVFRKYL